MITSFNVLKASSIPCWLSLKGLLVKLLNFSLLVSDFSAVSNSSNDSLFARNFSSLLIFRLLDVGSKI